MSILFSYRFVNEDAKRLDGTTLWSHDRPEKTQPKFPRTSIKCDLERVTHVETSEGVLAVKIYWSDEIFGSDGNGLLLKEGKPGGPPRDIALLELHAGQAWIVRSEPTLDDRIGVVVANVYGMPLMAGVGDLTPVDFTPVRKGLPPKRGHIFTCLLREIYSSRVQNPTGPAHTSGAARRECPACRPDYKAPDGGIP